MLCMASSCRKEARQGEGGGGARASKRLETETETAMATEMATLLKTCRLKLVTQGACSKQLQEIFTKAAIHFSISRIQKTCTCQMIVTRSRLVARPEVGPGPAPRGPTFPLLDDERTSGGASGC